MSETPQNFADVFATLYAYAYGPVAFLGTGLVYLYLGGNIHPMRCLVASLAPCFVIGAYIVLHAHQTWQDFAFSPLMPPLIIIGLGLVGVFGRQWGWRWKSTIGVVLLTQAVLGAAMIGVLN